MPILVNNLYIRKFFGYGGIFNISNPISRLLAHMSVSNKPMSFLDLFFYISYFPTDEFKYNISILLHKGFGKGLSMVTSQGRVVNLGEEGSVSLPL